MLYHMIVDTKKLDQIEIEKWNTVEFWYYLQSKHFISINV